MIHIYCGDGKGKTTAACGLAVRAAGSGMTVMFAQFFKSGRSSEVLWLEKSGDIKIFCPKEVLGRYEKLDDEKKAQAKALYTKLLFDIIDRSRRYDMIVLDEIISAYNYGMTDTTALLEFLKSEKNNREIVLTGRDPAPELITLADYVTEMKKIKHPYDNGVKARRGIEF